jgi:hypothetical protein
VAVVSHIGARIEHLFLLESATSGKENVISELIELLDSAEASLFGNAGRLLVVCSVTGIPSVVHSKPGNVSRACHRTVARVAQGATVKPIGRALHERASTGRLQQL